MTEFAQFLVFIALPSLGLLAAIGLSSYEIYRIEDYRLLLVIVLLAVMLQHQVLEASSFWATGVVSEPILGETLETTANFVAAGGIYYLLALLRREQSLAEELDQREQEYRALIESAPTPMLYHCPNQIRLVNDETLSMFNADSEADLLDRSLTEFVAPEDRQIVEQAIDPSSEYDTTGEQITLQSLDGSHRYAVFAAEPIRFGGRNGVQITLNDITERETSRQQLEQAKDRFQTLFNNIQHGVLVIDIENRTFVDANDRACEMLGYTKLELLDLEPVDIHPHEADRFEAFLESAQTQESLVTEGLNCRRKDGRKFSAEVSAETTQLDGTTVLLVSIRDITDRTLRRRQMEFMNRLFRHNIRNRLSVLIGNTEELRKRGGDEIAEIAEMIDSVGHRFAETSEKVRHVMDVLNDGINPGIERTDLSALVETCVSEYRDNAHDATFEATIEEELLINGDESIRLAIDNLLENAVAHAGPEPTITVTLRCDQTETKMAHLEIIDDGPGIPENERVVAANPDEQTQLKHGSGLGLHLVAQIIEIYGGEFSLDTPDDEANGTRACIRVPAAMEAATPAYRDGERS